MIPMLKQLLTDFNLLILTMVLFFIAKWLRDKLSNHRIDDGIQKNNLAVIFSLSGYFIGVAIIIAGSMAGESKGWLKDLLDVTLYGLLGITLLNLARWINDKVILPQINNTEAILKEQNKSVGIVQCGSYLATATILAGSIYGLGGGIHTALAFFILGQAALILFTKLYNLITPFDIHQEIQQDNTAAGIALGGTLIALGIILMNGVMGDFFDWKTNLLDFAIYSVVGFILLPLTRLFFDKILIPQASLNQLIAKEKHIGAALLEMSIAMGFATIIIFTLSF
ncbi:DUF350 domain-containing protein [Magnetococcales bacterium HHB-1]